MFKVKDKVEFTTLEYKESVCNNNWKEVKLNTEYEIGFVGYYDFGYGEETAISLRGIDYTGFIPAAILKLSKAKTTLNKDTVKVGQKVRVCNLTGNTFSDNNNAGHYTGYIGIVTKTRSEKTGVDSDHVWVYLDNKKLGIGTMHLELLEEPKSEYLTPIDLLKGGYYKTEDVPEGFSAVFKVVNTEQGSDSKDKRCKATFVTSEKEYKNSFELCYYATNGSRIFKEATKEEVEWLTACIMLGKYVSKEEIAKSKEVISEKEPEVLVFGKFKIGSIVVVTERYSGNDARVDDIGELFQQDNSKVPYRVKNSTINSWCKNIRQATPEEIKAFESGITNIKDMKKEEEDLVGRYLKALEDSPQNTGIKKDNFAKITYDNGDNYSIDNGCGVSKVKLATDWELMPVGFNPPEVKEEHSFYVKYEPDFTEDIFNKLVDWCDITVPNIPWYGCFQQKKYSDFQRNKYFYVATHAKGTDNNKQGAEKQLSLSELCTLIGYKQEVKVEDKWIVGKWYKAEDCYIKYLYTDNQHSFNKVYGQTITSEYFRVNDYWASNTLEKIALKNGPLTDLSEIQKFLPANHPDLIQKSNTTKEFKVGDWVTLISNSAMSCNSVGDTGKVTEICLDGDICRVKVLNKPEKDNNSYFKDIRKATPEEIAKARSKDWLDIYKETGIIGVDLAQSSSNASIDRILHYCRLRYKEGDTVIPLNHRGEASYRECTLQGEIQKYSNEEIGTGQTSGFLYANGKYAEIVSSSKQEYIPGKIKFEDFPIVPEDCFTFTEPKKQKYKFSEVEYLAKPINQQLDLPIVKKYKKKSIINL